MKTLIVGAGALGGVIAARMLSSGHPVFLATRDEESAQQISANGLTVTGVGGDVAVSSVSVAPLDRYLQEKDFDLVLLATKAHDAVKIASQLLPILAPEGTLLPIQNGGVPALLADQLGSRVLGGLSNLGATMVRHGLYEQRNAGHLLIGEFHQGRGERVERIRSWLGDSVTVKTTENLRGAIWSKLLLNCSVTTIGALAGCTMQEYIALPVGRELFEKAYDESLSVALSSGNQPEPMLVDPLPPAKETENGSAYDSWVKKIVDIYGALKPSMLQDFERRRITEIDFINGYVVETGRAYHTATPVNDAIIRIVKQITAGELHPNLGNIKMALEMAA